MKLLKSSLKAKTVVFGMLALTLGWIGVGSSATGSGSYSSAGNQNLIDSNHSVWQDRGNNFPPPKTPPGTPPGNGEEEHFWTRFGPPVSTNGPGAVFSQGPVSSNNEAGASGVNPANGALTLNITDLSIPERGLPFFLTRVYNSKIWRNQSIVGSNDKFVDRATTILTPSSSFGLGWQLHFGRAWKISVEDYGKSYWYFEDIDGVRHQLKPTVDTLRNNGRYRINYRTQSASAVKLCEVGTESGWNPDTLFVMLQNGTRYVMVDSGALNAPHQYDLYQEAIDCYYWLYTFRTHRIYDPDGNYQTIEYEYYPDDLAGPMVVIKKITDSCNRIYEFGFHLQAYWDQGPNIILTDSVRYTGSDGLYRYIKYRYDTSTVSSLPGYSSYTDTPAVFFDALSDIKPSPPVICPILRAVISPNGDSIMYHYNNLKELDRINAPQGGRIEYIYGEYWYAGLKTDLAHPGNPPFKDSLGTRAVIEKRAFASNSPIEWPAVTQYVRYDHRNSLPFTNPDSVVVIDPNGNEYVTNYVRLPWDSLSTSTLNRFFGTIQTTKTKDVIPGQKKVLRKKITEWVADQDGEAYKNLRPASDTEFVYSTAGDKKYVTLYHSYNLFLQPLRVDHLGDLADTSDDRSIFTEYLHQSQTSYADSNLIDRISRQRVFRDSLGAILLSETKYSYDDPSRIRQRSYTNPAPSHYDPRYDNIQMRGAVTKTERLLRAGVYATSYKNYDQCGNVIKTIDPNSHEVNLYYAPDAQPEKYQYAYLWKTEVPVSSGAGALYTYLDYDPNTGMLTITTEPNGNKTYFAYDSLDRLRKVAKPGDWTEPWPGWGSANVKPSLIRRYVSAQSGYPGSVIDSVKVNTTPQYAFTRTFEDGLGRPIQVLKTNTVLTSDSSIVQNISYDLVGQKDKASYPYKVVNTTGFSYADWWGKPCMLYQYDALGRGTKKKHSTLPDSVVTGYNGYQYTVSDEQGHNTIYTLNAEGQIAVITQPNGATTSYKYDHLGQLLQVTDAEGKATKYRYDYGGRVCAVKKPDAYSSYTYTDPIYGYIDWLAVLNVYDAAGNITWRKNDKGETEYRYDDLNRLTGVWFNTTQRAEYSYDVIPADPPEQIPSGLNNPLGKLTRVKTLNPTVETQKVYYDTRGRLGQGSLYLDALSKKTVKYSYNPADMVTTLTYPDNSTVNYNYTLLGQVTSIPGYLSNLKYNAGFEPVSMPYADNSTTTLTYDERLRPLTLVTNYNILSLTYTYTHGLVTSITNPNSSRNQTFQYDVVDRLSRVDFGSGGYDIYDYTPAGKINWINRSGLGMIVYSYYNNTNKVSSLGGGRQIGLAYENSGNLTSRNDLSRNELFNYTYDLNNNLATVSSNSGRTITNSYNAAGRRVKKVDSQTGTAYYVYNGIDVIAELNASGTITAKHVYGLGQHIAKVDGSGTHFYHNDAIGSVRAISKPGSLPGERGPVRPPVLEKEYGFYPYGETCYETGTLANTYKFAGKENVDGMRVSYDFSARYYDSEIGVFYSIDPFEAGDLSPYAYCRNNPLSYVDPSGLWSNSYFKLSMDFSGFGFEKYWEIKLAQMQRDFDRAINELNRFAKENSDAKIKELLKNPDITKVLGKDQVYAIVSNLNISYGYITAEGSFLTLFDPRTGDVFRYIVVGAGPGLSVGEFAGILTLEMGVADAPRGPGKYSGLGTGVTVSAAARVGGGGTYIGTFNGAQGITAGGGAGVGAGVGWLLTHSWFLETYNLYGGGR